MFVIKCPYCGERDVIEFAYGGDATKAYPSDGASEQEWHAYVYERGNPRGWHEEWWHHVHGCRQWAKVRRNTLTHEIDDTPSDAKGAVMSLAKGSSAGDEGEGA